LCALPLGIFAQDKLGHINSKEIISIMPEIPGIEKKIDELSKQWENEIMKMREEYNTKIKEYQQKQDSMPDGIKQIRMSEIQEMEQRISTFQQTAYTDLQKKQQDLVNPVIEKVRKAITDVAVENNYTYIFDLSAQSIIYQSPKSNDITALVKKKLAIK
ncbi:MAG: OmpH family outer membrane protein, partial [Bacteroidales bacterium]|nr:OmpH family outer membrane protein [Bacteroidales bacterium]